MEEQCKTCTIEEVHKGPVLTVTRLSHMTYSVFGWEKHEAALSERNSQSWYRLKWMWLATIFPAPSLRKYEIATSSRRARPALEDSKLCYPEPSFTAVRTIN